MASISVDVKISGVQMSPGEALGSISFSASSPRCPDDRDAIPARVAELVAKALAPYAKLAAQDAKKLEDANAALLVEIEKLRAEVNAGKVEKKDAKRGSLLDRAAQRVESEKP